MTQLGKDGSVDGWVGAAPQAEGMPQHDPTVVLQVMMRGADATPVTDEGATAAVEAVVRGYLEGRGQQVRELVHKIPHHPSTGSTDVAVALHGLHLDPETLEEVQELVARVVAASTPERPAS